MMAWDYTIVTDVSSDDDMDAGVTRWRGVPLDVPCPSSNCRGVVFTERGLLRAMGTNGWELVAVLDNPPRFYFKRPLVDSTPQGA